MTKHSFSLLFLSVAFVVLFCVATPCFANEANLLPVGQLKSADEVASETPATEQPVTGFAGWLGTYNKTLGMRNASIFTTIFGGAFVAFFIAICWGKLVELYGALGGLIGGGVIVGTFWVLNHKLPGVGIVPGGVPHEDGFGIHQYGLIVQAFHGTGPWIDMSFAVCVGLFTMSFLERLRARKLDLSQPDGPALLRDALPRVLSVILGGLAGGMIVGLIGFTGAKL
jgi:hypothetical protein